MRTHPRFLARLLPRLRCIGLAVLVLGLAACTTPKQPPLPVGNLTLGVAQFTQPVISGDMLAGFMAANTPRVDPGTLQTLDKQLAALLAQESKHHYVSAEKARMCYATATQGSPKQAALRTWSAVGRCMGVDLLLVPQIIAWQEREGSNFGAVIPAGLAMDSFIIDVNSETLISRSHFEEIQRPLSENLLNTGSFLRRGGRWVTTSELAQEAMRQAIKELGL